MILLRQNCWSEIKKEKILEKLKYCLSQLVVSDRVKLNDFLAPRFWAIAFPLLYLSDQLSENRHFLNYTGRLFQESFLSKTLDYQQKSHTKISSLQPLKIGYISHTLRKHSVGWLSRWLFHYHDKQKFQIYFYLIDQENDELTEKWVISNSYKTCNLDRNPEKIACKIQSHQINILVDLDGLTSNTIAQVLCLKPAPIQVTWLGSDASGLPTIDYFITDSYVLSADSQKHYTETLWYLRKTYLAVDGFEVGSMTLNRQDLQISDDTIVYLCIQSNLKYNPDICRLQLQIIKSVPKSIFLIKGTSDNQSIQELVKILALEINLEGEKIKFLSRDPDEATHRANLAIADVVLDTYPYSGATTTLETLWMGIPMVTKVGEQFSARNSYTFMMNAGLTEGIAWSDKEYVDWGIRLGKNQKLRQQISEKLQQSRKNSPLWNAKQFTLEIENAYHHMWHKYLHSS
jgi:predicted O-linked N-acetylglucosamine transferase (SPINDLY family)